MNKKRILIAEDFPILREILRAVLEKEEKYQVSFFSDGLELYRMVQESSPDLLVLDIILPGISGLAITRLLKFHDNYHKIPIIVMSSITDPEIKNIAKEAGANFFLQKPFQTNDLLNHISELLGSN